MCEENKATEECGLECLSDETLARLVETETDPNDDDRLNSTGSAAFAELYRRDSNFGR